MKDTDSKDEMTTLDDHQLQELYAWVDEISLTRPKRNITRDFSDGVLVAEVVYFFIPKIVELHNYTPANSMMQKMSNWGTLNRKVFSKISFSVPENVIRSICNCKTGVVEVILWQLRHKIEQYLGKKKAAEMSPDGYYGGQEVGSLSDRSEKHRKKLVPAGKPPKHAAPAPKAPTVHRNSPPSNLAKGRSMALANHNELPVEVRDLLDEKEQALLASQETVQILQAKVRRLENLLHLKDVRIEELTKKLQHFESRY